MTVTDITDDPEQRVPSELSSPPLDHIPQSLSQVPSEVEPHDHEERDMRKSYPYRPMKWGVPRNLTPEELRDHFESCRGEPLEMTPELLAEVLENWERIERTYGPQSRSQVLSENDVPRYKRKDSNRDFSGGPMKGDSHRSLPQG